MIGSEEERVGQISAAQSETELVCNRPAPNLPFSFGGRDTFTLDGSVIAIPIQIDPGIFRSELTASAMVMIDGQGPTKVAFSPSWTGGSAMNSLGVPLGGVTASVPNGSRVTLAVELTHASGVSGWTDGVLLERNEQGWRKVPLRGSGGNVGIDVDPRPPMTGSELAAMAASSRQSGARMANVDADERFVRAQAARIAIPNDPATLERHPAAAQIPSLERVPAAANSVRFSEGPRHALLAATTVCFRQVVSMTGENIGEDYYTSDGLYGSAGMFVFIGNPLIWWGSLNVWGCTPSLWLAGGTYQVTAFAAYTVNSRFVEVYTNGDTAIAGITWNASIGSGGTQTVDFWPLGVQEQFNIGIFAMNALAFNPGTASAGYVFNALNTTGCNGGGGSCNWGGEIHIAPNGGFDKFLVGHEHGHAFFPTNTSVAWPAIDYSINQGPAPCNDGGGSSHDIESVEYSSTTFAEAAASFYGAAAFNNTAQTDCAFYHPQYQNGVDCDLPQSSPDYDIPNAYMENRCNSPYAGKGVEFDWLRQLWDVRTDSGSPPSMNTMLSWINAISSGWVKDNGYQKLDAAANSVGGQLNTNWDGMKATNGVDN